jgi:hypothetical protein
MTAQGTALSLDFPACRYCETSQATPTTTI